jgi:hypothetical protein
MYLIVLPLGLVPGLPFLNLAVVGNDLATVLLFSSFDNHILVDCPRLRLLRQDLRRKVGDAFNSVSRLLIA